MVIIPTRIFTPLHLNLTSNQIYIFLDDLKIIRITELDLQFFIDKYMYNWFKNS